MCGINSFKVVKCVFLSLVVLFFVIQPCLAADPPVLLYSLISWGRLQGRVTFSWGGEGSNVTVGVTLEHTEVNVTPDPEELTWGIHDLPARYDVPGRCNEMKLGRKVLDLTSLFGKLNVPVVNQTFETDQIKIVGDESIWGKTIRFSGPKKTACGNIQGVEGEETYEARMYSPVGGSVWVRTWTWHIPNDVISDVSDDVTADVTEGAESGTEVSILVDVFNTQDDEVTSASHDWNLYITDILDAESSGFRTSCNFLTTTYDFVDQSPCENGVCSYGSLTQKFGQLIVHSGRSRFSRKIYQSSGSALIDLTGPRQIYIGIEDAVLKNNVYACARLRHIKPKSVQAIFSDSGVSGKISMKQVSVFTPTELTLDLENLREEAGGFHVHELPIKDPMKPDQSTCGTAAGHYNPYKVDPETSPVPGTGSHDQYELGDLSGKHGMLLGLGSISATVVDHSLPLFGPRSIIGRSIVIHKGDDGSRWICANLRPVVPLLRAVATFRYPLVGEIVMEQEEGDPMADTTVMVGPLLYSDGSHNDTSDHQWFIHDNIPNKDFYNWTQRCVSAGPRYNPYMVSTQEKLYRSCGIDNVERCEMGDLYKRLGPLSVAGSVRTALATRRLFTDSNIPLMGPYAIQGHSFVIEDRGAPKHRGNRMACTGIFRRFRYKGVVNTWKSTNVESDVNGKIEFIQETLYDVTNVEVDLKGLDDAASGYHVHMVPVLPDLAFPCAASTIYGHFNPLNTTGAPPPNVGTDDQYEIGDLSGKYGLLDYKSSLTDHYNDTRLPLFGYNSILGRSVVIHKRDETQSRWFCGNIGWGYAPSEARQIAAIASFHHPNGFAWGYVRLRQLIYNDGSMSDTSIEVNLRHPGNNNKNITRGHNWSIFVNPVGVDAAVKFFQSRCVAAGYRWNPFLIQLAHPNDRDYYDKQCTPEYPLRCDAGDVSGRLGTIDLGLKRHVFLDPNFPLAGEHSAMGKAIIIHNEQGRVENFACANILPDEDIVKWANIRRTGRFSASIFMYDMRKMLNAPEWFLSIDYETVTFSTDRECVTFRIYFMGPYARELEQDFSRLLAGGILENPTIKIPGTYPDPKRDKKVSYKACGGFEKEDLDKLGGKGNQWWDLTLYSSASELPLFATFYNLVSISFLNFIFCFRFFSINY